MVQVMPDVGVVTVTRSPSDCVQQWPCPVQGCCIYVCMNVIFIRCNRHASNNKHKKQSQIDVHYKAAKPKTVSLDKAI